MDGPIQPLPAGRYIAHRHLMELRAISSSRVRLFAALLCVVIFAVTKILSNRSLLLDRAANKPSEEEEEPSVESFAERHNCQIIYVVGVEGAIHHGFTPVLETLALRQIDPETGIPFVVSYPDKTLRSALFGFYKESRPIDNPTLVRQVIRRICPRNGEKHVIIEDASFPSGSEDDTRTYRIHRQSWWLDSPMEEIAMSETAMNHPTNLAAFYGAYSEYADVRFLVLHRSYVETVASHYDHDGTPRQHSNTIRGFMLLIRRFLDAHPVDEATGRRPWTLVCVERMMLKFYAGDEEMMTSARRRIIGHLANFLGWPAADCPDCFDKWKDGDKDYLQILGEDNVRIVLDHMKKLGGIWPPVTEDALPEQKCSL